MRAGWLADYRSERALVPGAPLQAACDLHLPKGATCHIRYHVGGVGPDPVPLSGCLHGEEESEQQPRRWMSLPQPGLRDTASLAAGTTLKHGGQEARNRRHQKPGDGLNCLEDPTMPGSLLLVCRYPGAVLPAYPIVVYIWCFCAVTLGPNDQRPDWDLPPPFCRSEERAGRGGLTTQG
ncbi:hypothetical protein NDU88_009220 [Pleurodeles waltl]|uniref:Uncharacterized protein n=1 Tax=Pleurodeles waltl TaxID=8319 RepID=A0AAV7PS46_PLEWA|nr:hypothetical protein NDU88_009220 [Pleurodeles waltl]